MASTTTLGAFLGAGEMVEVEVLRSKGWSCILAPGLSLSGTRAGAGPALVALAAAAEALAEEEEGVGEVGEVVEVATGLAGAALAGEAGLLLLFVVAVVLLVLLLVAAAAAEEAVGEAEGVLLLLLLLEVAGVASVGGLEVGRAGLLSCVVRLFSVAARAREGGKVAAFPPRVKAAIGTLLAGAGAAVSEAPYRAPHSMQKLPSALSFLVPHLHT